MRRVAASAVVVGVVVALAVLVGVAGNSPAPAARGLHVVAAEDVWGSIARQLAGSRAHVTSVISNPAADPHEYEPTSFDARRVAGARLVILNGIGYDPWAAKLVAASPLRGRRVLTVGDLVGVGPGRNPHRWYSPADVQRTTAAIARDLAALDPGDARYFRARRQRFEQHRLRRYTRLIAEIGHRYRGVRVGASESVFAPLAQALGLDLVTPASFLRAVSEGVDPTARDTATVDRQIARRRIAVWVFNSQNSTPDVQRLTDAARSRGIPVATITETPTPAGASFEGWQSRQLQALAAALARATGR